MKNPRFCIVVFVLLCILLSSCQKSPAPDPETGTEPVSTAENVPSASAVTPAEEGKPETETEPETTASSDKYLLELKELSLKIELPLSWKDQMEIMKSVPEMGLIPPYQDYGLPENVEKVYIYLSYDNFGQSFEEATSEESVLEQLLLVAPEKDQITEQTRTKVMDREALVLTYFRNNSDGIKRFYRAYFIDDAKGRFYFIKYPTEQEGLDGLAAFAEDAQQAAESLTPFQSDPAVVTFEEKEQGFTLELPGNWITDAKENVWTLRPPVGTYDFPYPEAAVSIIYSPPGEGSSFEEVTSPENLQNYVSGYTLQKSEPGKIGEAEAMFTLWEWSTTITFEKSLILIDAGGGGYYSFLFDCEKGNEAYVPFRETAEQIIQSFRITKP